MTRRPLVSFLSRCEIQTDLEVLQLINRPAASKPNGVANGTAGEKAGEFRMETLVTQSRSSTEDGVSNLRTNENNPDEWGEFLHLPGQKLHDFGKIREEIVRDTDKMTGKNAGR